MVLPKERYNAAYFGDTVESVGIKDVAGYTGGYLEKGNRNRFDSGNEANPYSSHIKPMIDAIESLQTFNLNSVLELGGAVGFYAEYTKEFGATLHDVIEWSNWAFRNKIASIDTFTEDDAKTVLPTLATNQYNLILTCQFLECVADADLPALITEMNRVASTKQIHVVTVTINRDDTRGYYNLKTLAEWATQGFNAGTILVDQETLEVLVV